MPNQYFFKRKGPFKLSYLAQAVGGETVGDGELLINDVSTLAAAQPGEISFLSNAKYTAQLAQTKASACILDKRNAAEAAKGINLIVIDNAYAAYAQIANLFYPMPELKAEISAKATVSKSAKIGKGVRIEDGAYICDHAEIGDGVQIGANSYIGEGVKIESGTRIAPHVTIACALIGKNCIIHPGVRIGQDGFGFAQSNAGMLKVPQLGGVVVGNDVEIGANTCIDRGTLEDTIVGDGTKIDNLVQLGHGAVIGKHCVIVGQVGIAGSTHIGNGVMIGGQAGVAGHLNVGDQAMIAAKSCVLRDVPARMVVSGHPAVQITQWHRMVATLRKLINKHDTEESSDNRK